MMSSSTRLRLTLAVGAITLMPAVQELTKPVAAAPVPKQHTNTALGTLRPQLSCSMGDLWTFCFDDDVLCGTHTHLDTVIHRHDLATGNSAETCVNHGERVSAVCVSPDRKFVATGSGKSMITGVPPKDATVRLFDRQTDKEVAKLEGHTRRVVRLYLGDKRDRLLSVGENEEAILWDWGAKKQLAKYPCDDPDDVVLSPDGLFVVEWKQKDRTLSLWDSETGEKLVSTIRFADEDGARIPAIDFATLRVLTSSREKPHPIRLWDIKSGELLKTFMGHTDYISTLAFVPSTKRIAAGSADGTVRVWNVDNGKEEVLLKHDGRVEVLHPSRNGRSLFVEAQLPKDKNQHSYGILWDIETGKEIAREDDFVGFNPDGSRYLTAASLKGIVAGKPVVWYDSLTGKKIER
jgi:WD40 repeat protein